MKEVFVEGWVISVFVLKPLGKLSGYGPAFQAFFKLETWEGLQESARGGEREMTIS